MNNSNIIYADIRYEEPIIPKRDYCELCQSYNWVHKTIVDGEELYLCNKCRDDLLNN